jgi:hypothetical protein
VKISKTEHAVFVYYKLESTYKSSKFEAWFKIKKKSDLKWNASEPKILTVLYLKAPPQLQLWIKFDVTDFAIFGEGYIFKLY